MNKFLLGVIAGYMFRDQISGLLGVETRVKLADKIDEAARKLREDKPKTDADVSNPSTSAMD